MCKAGKQSEIRTNRVHVEVLQTLVTLWTRGTLSCLHLTMWKLRGLHLQLSPLQLSQRSERHLHVDSTRTAHNTDIQCQSEDHSFLPGSIKCRSWSRKLCIIWRNLLIDIFSTDWNTRFSLIPPVRNFGRIRRFFELRTDGLDDRGRMFCTGFGAVQDCG